MASARKPGVAGTSRAVIIWIGVGGIVLGAVLSLLGLILHATFGGELRGLGVIVIGTIVLVGGLTMRARRE